MWDSQKIVPILHAVLSSKTTVSVISLAVGAGSTYFVTNKVLKMKYEELSEREIDEARRFYKRGEYSDPVRALKKIEEDEKSHIQEEVKKSEKLVKDLGYTNEFKPAPHGKAPVVREEPELEEEVEVVEEVVVQNIFVEGNPLDFNYEEELANRSENYPYVITHEEFLEGEKDYSQNKMTYFEDDDILLDDEDNILDPSDPIVGDSNLDRFGHGSKDHNVVYIRNDRLEIDIEVVRDSGSYVKQVLGFNDEDTSITHSGRRPIRRMRSADE